ncbi:MAG: DsrE family protein [Arenicella sp.]|jgi:tRNA 2-thiouridine synthesizing protein C|nr:DsrE family protein [Arenicella sp.]HAU67626.1 hypothetical protein [Gammaproteobacteria bacterium]
MSKTTILYVFRSSAWHGRSAADGLDALMASCAMELNVSALFLHDGVFIVKRGQGQEQSNTPSSQLRGSTIRPKLLSKPFAALYDFGCEHVYVCHKSLNARGLCTDDLTVEHELVSRDQIATLIDQHDEVLVF